MSFALLNEHPEAALQIDDAPWPLRRHEDLDRFAESERSGSRKISSRWPSEPRAAVSREELRVQLVNVSINETAGDDAQTELRLAVRQLEHRLAIDISIDAPCNC